MSETEAKEVPIEEMDLAALADKFAELAGERSEHEEEVGRLKKAQEELKGFILTRMQETGISRLRSEKHSRTIFLHRQLWAKAQDGNNDRMFAALREAGMGDMIHEAVNTNTLSSWVRDLAQEQDADIPELPPELKDAVGVTEKYDVRAVRSK